MRVLIAGGGTAGHINPALAILSIIKEREPDSVFLYAGTPDGMESRLVPKEGIDFAPIKVSGFQRRLSVENVGRNIKAVHYLIHSGRRARQIIKGFSPDIVIGTGGYVSGPVVLAAAKMGIPTVIHEQNAYPGVTTRTLSKYVDGVMLTMEEAAKYLHKGVEYTLTGLPVRKGFGRLPDRTVAKRELGLYENVPCILSYGGSLGAGAINDSAAALIKWEKDSGMAVSHIHSYGRMGKDTFVKSLTDQGIDVNAKGLIISEYINNMDVCTAAADLIICRSGASAITELEVAGRASVLIPSPIVAGNHQYHNAMVLGKAGAAVVIEQKDLTDELIIDKVKTLISSPETLREYEQKAKGCMIEDTPDRIYKVIRKAFDKRKV
ncbi:MAG: undecaprenyldiphospho-muramoylpentapeptide beta-N-acetylglucosaminyltransferase [Oscillospiraceae bacterium]|nr:undecaprenyldiphospho-muramoylpentapeptide beta-N-acetylglucosaminyltransferase [Oscillospiraceae bacterium]